MEDLAISTFASYLPNLVKQRLAENPDPITSPRIDLYRGAVLFTDISGFTALTEKLSQSRESGIEDLSRILNDHFGQLITLVTAHGGDIIKFAGDALLAVWPVINQDEGLSTLTQRAAQCGLAIQSALHDYQTSDGTFITLRIAIGAGDIAIMHLGGAYQRWELLLTGKPLIDVGNVQHLAKPGQVVVSPDAWKWISPYFHGIPIEPEKGEVNSSILLKEPRVELSLIPLPVVNITPEMTPGIRAYIPGAILSRLAAGQFGWLAELRRVTVLFVNLPDLNFATPVEKAQEMMSILQRTLYHYEGSINKLNVDDKGTTLVAALGLPPMAHSDDAVRALQAMQDAQNELRSQGIRTAIGIASGTAFCGSIGMEDRREYTLVGDVVNLAARLMQLAQDTVICDHETYENARSHLVFDVLPPVHVKGKSNIIKIYSPTGRKHHVTRPQTELIGRVSERATIADRLQALLRGVPRNILVIEGIAGIGKSRLIEDFLRQARSLGIQTLLGSGDAIEKATPYHAWQLVFSELFDLDSFPDPENRKDHVGNFLRSIFRDHPQSERLLGLAPLLNAILHLDFPENEITQQMDGEVRAANIRELLIQLLNAFAHERPLGLVIEDGQWLDSSSWTLAWMVSQQVQPAIMIIATRPFTESVPNEYIQIIQDPITHRMEIGVLSPNDALDLVRQRLGVNSLPQSVSDLIREKAEGHPFFSEELAYALRDTGVILIKDGGCQLAEGKEDLSHLHFPSTINGVITSRIDRLTPQQQLTLKVASVIGRIFAYRILRDVHPLDADRGKLSNYLENLDKLDITIVESLEPELLYIFKHIITQEVVYNMMLFSQREQLHRAVAEWYEREYKDDLSPYYSLLAHHWEKANEPDKAVVYLGKSGEQALHDYANQEAIQFLSSAIEMVNSGKVKTEITSLQLARWENQLGEAYSGLGDLPNSRFHLEQTLSLLGRPPANTRFRMISSLARGLGWQIWLRVWPKRTGKISMDKRERLLIAARTNKRLSEIFYYANLQTEIFNAGLQALNLAESAGPSPELANAYADMCIIAGTIPFHGLARMYRKRALEVAHQISHASASAYVRMSTCMYIGGICEWNKTIASLELAIEMAKQLGDNRLLGESTTIMALSRNYMGDFAMSSSLFDMVFELAKHHENKLQQAWGLVGLSGVWVRTHEENKAVNALETALDLLKVNIDSTEEIRAYGYLTIAYLYQKQYQKALKTADRIVSLVASSIPSAFTTLEGYAGMTETYLTIWELQQAGNIQPDQAYDLKIKARQACRLLRRFANAFPIGRPSAWLWKGKYDWLSGKKTQAFRSWEKSIEFAKQLNMPFDEGRALFEYGQHLPLKDPSRLTYLQAAKACFKRVGASYDLGRVVEHMES